MRRLSIICVAAMLLILSCSKDQVKKQATAPINQGLIDEVESASTLAVQKLSFRLLNSTEKATLWQRQILYYTSANLNAAQKAHLLLLSKFISNSPQIFDAGYDHARLEQFSKPWLAKAKSLFPDALLKSIVASIHTAQSCKDIVDASNQGTSTATKKAIASNVKPDYVEPTCACASDSDYCDMYSECTGGSQNCVGTVGGGCGFLLVYNCDGMCTGGA